MKRKKKKSATKRKKRKKPPYGKTNFLPLPKQGCAGNVNKKASLVFHLLRSVHVRACRNR
jgi:hypothetical protein